MAKNQYSFEIEFIIKDFINNIDTLRDFVEFVESPLRKEVKEHDKLMTSEYFEIRKKLRNIKTKKEAQEVFNTMVHNEKEQFEVLEYKESFYLIPNTDHRKNHNLIIDKVSKNNSKFSLLSNSSLISLVSFSEIYLNRLFSHFFTLYPKCLNLGEKNIVFNTISNLKSIKQIEQQLIHNEVDNIMRGNAQSWFTYLNEKLKIDFNEVKHLESKVFEVFLRRNLIVHNGGIVNDVYLSKVSTHSKYKNGEKVKVTKKYLLDSIDTIEIVFFVIGYKLWKQIDKVDIERPVTIQDIIYNDFMLKDRWLVAEILLDCLLSDNTKQIDKAVTEINLMLCKKRLNKTDEFKEMVDKFDDTDKNLFLKLGFAALKEDEKFFDLLEASLITKEIDFSSLEEMPVFEEIKQHPKYQNLKRRMKKRSYGVALNPKKSTSKRLKNRLG